MLKMELARGNTNLATVNNGLGDGLLMHYYQEPTTLNSPISLLGVLVPLMIGTSGESLEQLCTALQASPKNLPKLVEEFSNLMSTFAQNKKSTCIEMTTVMLSRDSIPLHSGYLHGISKLCSHQYFSETDIAELASKVNRMVQTKTHGLIDNILNPEDITNDVFFVLLNTLYFKSKWAEPFNTHSTQQKPFLGLTGERPEQMMHHYMESFAYAETSTLQFLIMPYEDRRFAMYVVLPKDRNAKASIVSEQQVADMARASKYYNVNVVFPKFTQESELNLMPFLQASGVTRIFEDLEVPRMTDNRELKYISLIKQKVKVIVDEAGTEAAAATVMVGMLESCSMSDPKPTANFVADHEFAYYIVYNNIVLFSGTYK